MLKSFVDSPHPKEMPSHARATRPAKSHEAKRLKELGDTVQAVGQRGFEKKDYPKAREAMPTQSRFAEN